MAHLALFSAQTRDNRLYQARTLIDQPGIDLNQHGPDSIRFYTKTKTVTQRWPSGLKESNAFVIPTMD